VKAALLRPELGIVHLGNDEDIFKFELGHSNSARASSKLVGRAVGTFARMAARIKAAVPLPPIGAGRVASALGDRADADEDDLFAAVIDR
jgi:hypothetical protein